MRDGTDGAIVFLDDVSERHTRDQRLQKRIESLESVPEQQEELRAKVVKHLKAALAADREE